MPIFQKSSAFIYFTFCLIFIFNLSSLVSVKAEDEKNNPAKQNPSTKNLDPVLSMEAAKKFPANQWVMNEIKINIPEKWNKGRYRYINTYASIVYCESVSLAMTMDGYTYTPDGQSSPNNYSDSVYTFDPIKNELELIKRSNWRAGARTNEIEKTSYPLEENKSEPTPCPRHIYHGVTWLADTNSFYLINGANAGIPNAHPNYKEFNGTDTRTFWAMNVETRVWKQLEFPPLKRVDPYETHLIAIPGSGKLIYMDDWSIASYDTKESKWSVLLGNNGTPIKVYRGTSANLLDTKRNKIIFFGGRAWRPVKDGAPIMAKNQLQAYDVNKNSIEVITGTGVVEFENIRPSAYLSDIDRYLFLTDKGHFLFNPNTNQWQKLDIEMPKVPLKWCYMTYDTKRGLVILNEGKQWAVLRLTVN